MDNFDDLFNSDGSIEIDNLFGDDEKSGETNPLEALLKGLTEEIGGMAEKCVKVDRVLNTVTSDMQLIPMLCSCIDNWCEKNDEDAVTIAGRILTCFLDAREREKRKKKD